MNIDFTKFKCFDLSDQNSIPKCCGIYCFRNKINNKCYIGKSINIKKRIKHHLKLYDTLAIHSAIKKYGIVNFEFFIIEELELDNKLMSDREIYWINKFNSFAPNGYNLTLGGEGMFGTTLSEERKEAIRLNNSKKVIGYNYIKKYYIECGSRIQMESILLDKGIKINRFNIEDSINNKSYSGEFIFGNSISDIQYVLHNKKLPGSINYYIYDTNEKKYCGKFTSCVDIENLIRSKGITITSGHVSTALKKNNKHVKGFLIATSLSELRQKINEYKDSIYAYNTETNTVFNFKTSAEASRELTPKCSITDIRKCLNEKQIQINNITFGYTNIDAIERGVKYLEKKLNTQINKLLKKKHLKKDEFDKYLRS